MILFNNDYTQGCHPLILEKLTETNIEQTPGYGQDHYCKRAAELIREKCQAKDAKIHFLTGGTQTNVTVIAAALKAHQGVITAETGHIHVHETGAVEACGHKILALPHCNGKLRAEQIAACVDGHFSDSAFEHAVQPKMVYISNPTELGTIYQKSELEEISKVCRQRGLYLFLDGARLGYGLMSRENDLDLPAIAQCCDVFSIGGTKVGALFGEAVVITNRELKQDFRYMMKQKGGMLAKGRLLGIQFEVLFEQDLYFQIASHGAKMADKLKKGLKNMGVTFYIDSPTNQQFLILSNEVCKGLEPKYGFNIEEKIDETHSVVRFCTCWATKEQEVEQLLEDIRQQLEESK